jgi:hypothetical protein
MGIFHRINLGKEKLNKRKRREKKLYRSLVVDLYTDVVAAITAATAKI